MTYHLVHVSRTARGPLCDALRVTTHDTFGRGPNRTCCPTPLHSTRGNFGPARHTPGNTLHICDPLDTSRMKPTTLDAPCSILQLTSTVLVLQLHITILNNTNRHERCRAPSSYRTAALPTSRRPSPLMFVR